MAAVHNSPQINFTHPAQATNVSDDDCRVSKIAIHAIRALGVILMAASIGCIIAGLQVPAIALLVAGAAALVLGFTLDKSRETNSVLQEVNDLPTPAMAFGRKEWIQYMGVDPGEVPPLPANIDEILAKESYFWLNRRPQNTDKTVANMHMLVLIPKTITKLIDGAPVAIPLTLRNLRDLLAESAGNNLGINFADRILEIHGDTPIEKSHWILMTKDVVECNGNYDAQKYMVEGREIARRILKLVDK